MQHTSPEMEAKFRESMMARSPGERLAMACRMLDTAKALVQAGILHQHGPLPPNELRRRTFLRLYGQDFSDNEAFLRRIAKEYGDAV